MTTTKTSGRNYSGLTTLRMEPAVHARLAHAAAEAGLTMNDYLVGSITDSLEGRVGRAVSERDDARREAEELRARLERAIAERDEALKTVERIVGGREARAKAESDPDEAADRRPPSASRDSCGVCGKTTSGRKPFCVDHLDRMPYVQRLEGEIARRGGSGALGREDGDEADGGKEGAAA